MTDTRLWSLHHIGPDEIHRPPGHEQDEAFCSIVWDALKGDHSDLRRQQIILEAHRAAALTAITEAGMVIVPKHPGKAILDAMARVDPRPRMQDFDHEKYLAALKAASPLDTKEGE